MPHADGYGICAVYLRLFKDYAPLSSAILKTLQGSIAPVSHSINSLTTSVWKLAGPISACNKNKILARTRTSI